MSGQTILSPCPKCGKKAVAGYCKVYCEDEACAFGTVTFSYRMWHEITALCTKPAGGLYEVLSEVNRATKKFPTWPTDPLHALAVLGEEFGELTKAALQQTYEPHKTSLSEIRKEAIQTAAMALRWVMSLDQYRYAPCEQHSQGIPIPSAAPVFQHIDNPEERYG